MSFFGDLFKKGLWGFDPVLAYVVNKGGKGGGGSGGVAPISQTFGADALAKLDAAEPNYRRSYDAAGGAAGLNGRSFDQWLADHLALHPEDPGNQMLKTYDETGQMLSPTGGDGYEPVYADDPTSSGEVPVEQGIYNLTKDRLLGDVEADAGRRDLATALGQDLQSSYNSAKNTLAGAMGPTFDAESYFAANPDVAQAFVESGGKMFDPNGPALSAEQFALKHYEEAGKQEGRQGAFTSQLQREYANADRTAGAVIGNAQESAASQLAALQTYAANLRTNLSGEMQQRAAALEQQIASLNQNLDKYDEAEKAALLKQISAMGQNLETSINSQRENLTTELAGLQGAVDAEGQARKAALETEIQKLNAAQAPVAEARLGAANTAATAVNLGLQQQLDRQTANDAQQGFVGGSSASEANALRAAIAARQNAAAIMGQARVSNAADTRDVATREATEGRSIADAIAAGTRAVTERGATGNRTLSDALATGKQQIGDYGATQERGITSTTNQGRLNVNNLGATTSYTDALYNAAQGRQIGDTQASGTLGVNTNLATQTQQAKDAAAAAKSGYFDADYTRKLGAALTLPGLTTNLTNSLTGLDNYGNSGLTRSLNTLNWWSTSGTAPTPGYVPIQADTTGQDIAGLGAGLFSGGASIASAGAKNWFTPKTTTPVASSTPVFNYQVGSTKYQSPLYDAGYGMPITTGGIA